MPIRRRKLILTPGTFRRVAASIDRRLTIGFAPLDLFSIRRSMVLAGRCARFASVGMPRRRSNYSHGAWRAMRIRRCNIPLGVHEPDLLIITIAFGSLPRGVDYADVDGVAFGGWARAGTILSSMPKVHYSTMIRRAVDACVFIEAFALLLLGDSL